MNNEPVAWWDGKEPSVLGLSYFKNDYCPIPLYTHPAKTLTDEEIDDIASMCSVNEKDQINDREFARAILKKASEK